MSKQKNHKTTGCVAVSEAIKRPHMKKVRSKDTTPELKLRRMLLDAGYRGYRVNYSKLPGKPDVAFTKRMKAIFVHGCFWHGHDCRAGRNTPGTNTSYWGPKLARNKARDAENMKLLKKQVWKTLVIWECEQKDPEKVKKRIEKFMGG